MNKEELNKEWSDYLKEPQLINEGIRQNIIKNKELKNIPKEKKERTLEKVVKDRSKEIKEKITEVLNSVFKHVRP